MKSQLKVAVPGVDSREIRGLCFLYAVGSIRGGANHSDNMKTLALIRCCCGARSGDENRDPLAGVEAAAMVNETGGDG